MARFSIVVAAVLFLSLGSEVRCANRVLRTNQFQLESDGDQSSSTQQPMQQPKQDPFYWTRYWFMCPVALCVSICANLVGIGGAAFFAPMFIIGFPLLGPEYELHSPLAAVAISLGVELFGFSSGMMGYVRRGLVDFQGAGKFAIITVPASLAATLVFSYFPLILLKGLYVALMYCLSAYLLFWRLGGKDQPDGTSPVSPAEKVIVDSDGKSYNLPPIQIGPSGYFLSILGGWLMGFLGVGAGEVVLPQLLSIGFPAAIAAPTSVAVVVATVASTVWMQMMKLIRGGGLAVIPWNILCWMAPTVVVGAQIATLLQGKFKQTHLVLAIGLTFGIVGMLSSIALGYQTKTLTF